MAALQKEFADEGVRVMTICQGSSAKEVREALKEANAESVLALVDEDMETMIPYHVTSTPITYLIDRDGVIQMSDAGYDSGTKTHLRNEIERLLEK